MLFLLNSAGVPSVGKIMQIAATPPATGTVSGTVTNAANSVAISGAKVSYSGGSATTDASGHYTLANVAVGSYTVTASASGFGNGTQSVTVAQDATTTANFALNAAASTGTIKGKITNIS